MPSGSHLSSADHNVVENNNNYRDSDLDDTVIKGWSNTSVALNNGTNLKDTVFPSFLIPTSGTEIGALAVEGSSSSFKSIEVMEESYKREKESKEMLFNATTKMNDLNIEINNRTLDHDCDVSQLKRKSSNLDKSLLQLHKEMVVIEAMRDKKVAESNIMGEILENQRRAAFQSEILLVSNFSRRQWEHSEKATQVLFKQLKGSEPSYLRNLDGRDRGITQGIANYYIAAPQVDREDPVQSKEGEEAATEPIIEASISSAVHLPCPPRVTASDNRSAALPPADQTVSARGVVCGSGENGLPKDPIKRRVKKRSVSGNYTSDKNNNTAKKLSRANDISSLLLELDSSNALKHKGTHEISPRKDKTRNLLQGRDTSVDSNVRQSNKQRKKKKKDKLTSSSQSPAEEDKKTRKNSKKKAPHIPPKPNTPSLLEKEYTIESVVNSLDKRPLDERVEDVLKWYQCREAERKCKSEEVNEEIDENPTTCMTNEKRMSITQFTEWKQQHHVFSSPPLLPNLSHSSEYENKRRSRILSENDRKKENLVELFSASTIVEASGNVYGKTSSRGNTPAVVSSSSRCDRHVRSALRGGITEPQLRFMHKHARFRTAAIRSMDIFKDFLKEYR